MHSYWYDWCVIDAIRTGGNETEATIQKRLETCCAYVYISHHPSLSRNDVTIKLIMSPSNAWSDLIHRYQAASCGVFSRRGHGDGETKTFEFQLKVFLYHIRTAPVQLIYLPTNGR